MRSRYAKPALLALLTLLAWAAATAALAARPAAALEDASGLYAVQAGPTPYRWTSNRVDIPIRGGPTTVALTIGPSRWPGRPAPLVTLSSDRGSIAAFPAPDHSRRYRVALPAPATTLTLETTADRAPAGDPRWLGVAIYGLTADASGLTTRGALGGLTIALIVLAIALAAAWGARRGYGAELGLGVLALALRLALLDLAPSGWRTDEVVSLVDAWNIARTARDHLGHFLPLGAQEALGDWISPLLTYLELPLVALLGPQRLVGRLVTAVYGALAAPLCYRLGRELRLPAAAAICAGLVAALSPAQIFLSRNGLPPALVPTSWAACLLVALVFLRRGGRRDALILAAVAGVALYSYPTMKLAVPLLCALAACLALARHGWRSIGRWLPGAGLAALLWLPFAYVTLFVPASSTRLDQTTIDATSLAEWLAAWWRGYSVYFLPGFYYVSGDGSPIRGVPGHGAELLATAPLVVAGLAVVLWQSLGRLATAAIGIGKTPGEQNQRPWRSWRLGDWATNSYVEWCFLAGAILIAPLPASLTQPSPHAYRAATIAPLYALLAGLGAAALWGLLARVAGPRGRRAAQAVASMLVAGALAWQAAGWLRDYTGDYPPQRAWENQDGLGEAMRRAVGHAQSFDEVWISYEDINEPYIYLLAARPMPPAEAQAQIVVSRRPGHLNDILGIGRYRFVGMDGIPRDLPAIEAIPDRFGGAAFVLQAWQKDGKRILVVRRMD